MGYIKHDIAFATVSMVDTASVSADFNAWKNTLPPEWQSLAVGPIQTIVNGGDTYIFAPDGGKEWRETSNDGDAYREQFRALFDRYQWVDGVNVRFGGDDASEVNAEIWAS